MRRLWSSWPKLLVVMIFMFSRRALEIYAYEKISMMSTGRMDVMIKILINLFFRLVFFIRFSLNANDQGKHRSPDHNHITLSVCFQYKDYPFTAPLVIPLMMYFCMKMKISVTGMIATIAKAVR